jgi:cytochrome c
MPCFCSFAARLKLKERLMNDRTKLACGLLVAAMTLLTGATAQAAEGGASKDDAVSMVKKGVVHIKAGPADKAYADISDKANAAFHDRDLYLVVYGLDGVVHAHGANAKMVGKNLIELKDVDGKAFVRERVELGQKNATFWQDYKFKNPENNKVEPKSMYCERLNETVVCGGIYK